MGCACSSSSSATSEGLDGASAASSDSVVGHGRAARYRGPSSIASPADLRTTHAIVDDVRSCASDGETYLARFENDASSLPHAVPDCGADDGSHGRQGSVMDLFESVARSGYFASSEVHDQEAFDDGDGDGRQIDGPRFALPPPRDVARRRRVVGWQ